jgi:hypothetical protein
MSRFRLTGLLVGLLALGAAASCAGCGNSLAPVAASRSAASVALRASPELAYAAATSQATWAVLPMGAPSGPNEFWQLFLLAPAQRQWALDTPPDIATNGAIELAGFAGTSIVTGIRPSLYLAFSPVSLTSDAGKQWTAGPPAQGLADVPDALAATPGGGRLLALDKAGQVSTASSAGSAWTPVVSQKTLAGTPAGRRCGLAGLTAVAYSPADAQLVAGDCTHQGVAGIFSRSASGWRAIAPALPPALADSQIQVVRLVTASGQTASPAAPPQTLALLRAVTGSHADLIAAWLGANGSWTTSAPLSIGDSAVRTSAFSASGGVAAVLSSGRAEVLSGPSGTWQQTPLVPAGRAVTIALPATGAPEALAATAGVLTVWQLGDAGSRWEKVQTVKVPIQYGSSS